MKGFLVEELDINLGAALAREPIISKELDQKLRIDPDFLSWWGDEPVNDLVMDALVKAAQANDYQEYDNYDFIIKSMWSKQKGVGKSSAALAMKLMYDENVTENGFDINEVFFMIPEKLEYIKEHENELVNRFFVLDEMVPLIGQSSKTDTIRMLRIDDTTRIKGYNNAYVSPRGEEQFSHDYYIEVALKDVDNNTLVCCLKARDGTPLGWIGFPRPPYNIWKKYQNKKHDFLKKLQTGNVTDMQFKEVYERVDERFGLEEKYSKQLDYTIALDEWIEDDKKSSKPIRPFIIITPSRIRKWLAAVNREMTNQELDTGCEVVYNMLEKKFKGGDGSER